MGEFFGFFFFEIFIKIFRVSLLLPGFLIATSNFKVACTYSQGDKKIRCFISSKNIISFV